MELSIPVRVSFRGDVVEQEKKSLERQATSVLIFVLSDEKKGETRD